MRCEICGRQSNYCSSHWLMQGGMMVLYWCKAHAPVDAEYFSRIDDEIIKRINKEIAWCEKDIGKSSGVDYKDGFVSGLKFVLNLVVQMRKHED